MINQYNHQYLVRICKIWMIWKMMKWLCWRLIIMTLLMKTLCSTLTKPQVEEDDMIIYRKSMKRVKTPSEKIIMKMILKEYAVSALVMMMSLFLIHFSHHVYVQGQWDWFILIVLKNGLKVKRFRDKEKLYQLTSGRIWSVSYANNVSQLKLNWKINKKSLS